MEVRGLNPIGLKQQQQQLQGSEFCQQPHESGIGPQASDDSASVADTLMAVSWDPDKNPAKLPPDSWLTRNCEVINVCCLNPNLR